MKTFSLRRHKYLHKFSRPSFRQGLPESRTHGREVHAKHRHFQEPSGGETPNIAILGIWIPAIPAGMTIIRVCEILMINCGQTEITA